MPCVGRDVVLYTISVQIHVTQVKGVGLHLALIANGSITVTRIFPVHAAYLTGKNLAALIVRGAKSFAMASSDHSQALRAIEAKGYATLSTVKAIPTRIISEQVPQLVNLALEVPESSPRFITSYQCTVICFKYGLHSIC